MKSKNLFELDPERLATTDEHGRRVYLYPEDVKGRWKTRRTYIYNFLIFLYLVFPWFYINGKPLLMLNFMKREFTFLGQTLFGIEPLFFFLLFASGLFFIAFLTSSFGRIWCGWSCPQTVFIQALFMKIETFIEGKSRERRERDRGPWSLNKFLRKALKWMIFTIAALHITHTFFGYFVGPRELFLMTLHSPRENFVLFIATMIGSIIILFDFGMFREQFCIIACPYGRMQSVMMDENSLVVAYDAQRGEPRRGSLEISSEVEGDCINCYQCVKVCPTGIDIRRGTQLECIACTLCIDACDNIMDKLKRTRGLIRYSSASDMAGKKNRRLGPRTIVYVLLSLLFCIGAFHLLNTQRRLEVIFLRANTPYQEVDNGKSILNHFTLKITHQGNQEYRLKFSVQSKDPKNIVEVITPENHTLIDGPTKKIVVFFRFPSKILNSGSHRTTLDLYDEISQQTVARKEVVLVGPTH